MTAGRGVVEHHGMPNPEWLETVVPGRERIELLTPPAAAVDAWLSAWYRPPHENWVRMNMLGSLNGKVAGPDGTSDSLSNRADRRILRLIREMSDVILVGAQTVRNERHLATRPTWLCILTESGDLTGHRISPEDAAASVIVVAPADAHGRVLETMPGANVVAPASGGTIQLPEVLELLRDRGLRSVVVEGGASLISQFLDADLLDEICLTLAPVFAEASAPNLPAASHLGHYRQQVILRDAAGYLYLRLIAERERRH